MKSILLLAAALLPFSMPAQVTCGSVVSGSVVLTSDVVCNWQPNKPVQIGLAVGADHTTIDLNGHTISCAGPGLAGTCQQFLQNVVLPGGPPFIGIASGVKNKVKIKGPGTIYGFGVGIRLSGGTDLTVQDLTVSGPAQTVLATNQRLINPGILVANSTCPAQGHDAVTVKDNEVMNQSVGIVLDHAECVTIRGNYTHDNNGNSLDHYGIKLLNSRKNSVTGNIVERNGTNRRTSIVNLGDIASGGILLLPGVSFPQPGGPAVLGDASENEVTRNIVRDNCGDGILAASGAQNNLVEKNEVRFNGTQTFGGQCLNASLLGPFFDLSERGTPAPAGNTWNSNNLCRTSGATIPAGVCGPNE